MNREIVNHILDVLKTSTDKSVILKGLVKLRTDLVKDRDGIVLFNECGGIPPMVRFLKKPHEQILEVVLSILGNCCTNSDCCKEAFDSKISIPLATILKSIPNNLIQCRACRLLGNLAKVDNSQLLSSHCPAFASALCQILAENNDVQTQIMCFRACRFLLVDEQFMRHFLLSDGCTLVLKILVDLMKIKEKKPVEVPVKLGGLKNTQHREKYFVEVAQHLEGVPNEAFDKDVLKRKKVSEDYAMPTDKAVIDLVNEILKCLLIISEATLNVQSLEAINRTNSFSVIVSFASEKNPFRAIGLKILSNFSKSIDAVPALGTANAIVAACELILTSEMEKPLTEAEIHHCINVICLLSGDACNRAKIRRLGGIPKLLTIARSSKSQQEISSILYVLNNFQYDLTSMEIMLREGLVGILVSEMDSYMHSEDEYKKKKREEKKNSSRKRKQSEITSETANKVQKVREESLLECESPWSSPRSITSPSSPCSSRSMSPTGSSFKLTSGNDSDSETYSPVCSDDEGADDDGADDDPKKTDPQKSDIMKLLDTACKSEGNMEDNILDKEDDDDTVLVDTPAIKLPKYFNSSSGTIDIIENLFFRLTIVTKKRADLVKVETLKTIIEAIKTFGVSNSLCGSLTNILSESQFFAQVIKTGVVYNILELTKFDELKEAGYGFLETLGHVAESRYGKAELTGLLRLNDINQKRAAIAVGCAIKDEQVLSYLLGDCNALDTLINMILNNDADDELNTQAVDALTALSKTLNITIPGFKKDLFDSHLIFEESASFSPKTLDCDMKFVLYENETEIPVMFNKKLLSCVSEVFKLMLNSDFREGKDGEIRLKNYSVNGLKYFLNLIERFTQKKLFNIPSSDQYTSVIEALELSRVYIIPGMEKVIFEILIYMLDDTNCQGLLEWSMKNYHSQLSEIAINYYLCSNITAQRKVELFKRAQSSVYSKEWNQMIKDTLLGKCNDTVYYDSEIF